MPWDGSGNFTRTDGFLTGENICQTQAATSVDIQAVRFDNELNNLADGLEKCLTTTGETLPTASINMNSQKLTNLVQGTAVGDSVNFYQLQTYSPTGSMVMYGGSTAPASGEWLLCDGSAVSRTTYAALFSVISTTYGAGNGSTTFNLPDMRQRFPLGKAASGTGSTLGSTGGAIDHTHTGPSHTHSVPALSIPSHTHTISHTHTNGSLNAMIGISTGNSLLTMIRNGSVTFSAPSATYTAAGDSFSWPSISTNIPDLDNATVVPSTPVYGTTDGPSTGSSGSWSGSTGTGTTGSSGTGATSSNNPPYLVVNYLIKT